MATLDGIELFDSAPTSGAAFLLSTPVKSPKCVTHDGWIAEARDRYLVIRKPITLAGYAPTRDAAFRAAQQALDLLAMSREANLSIRDAETEHLTWWPESGQVLRITFHTMFSLGFSAKVEVRDANGRAVPPPTPPSLVWHDSARYFRRSQTTDDLFDSFRNLYLALESILDHIAPQLPNEKEGQWFHRALNEAHSRTNLTRFATRGATDPVNAIYRQLYSDTRNLLFHAKGSRPRYVPQGAASEKEAVTAVVTNLSQLYLALAVKEFNGKGIMSYVYPPVFDSIRQGIKDVLRLHVTDEPVPATHERTAISNSRTMLDLETRHMPEYDAPFCCGFIGTVSDPVLQQTTTLVSTLKGTPYAYGNLEGVLRLENVARFEGQLCIRMANSSMPKLNFAM
jgi:hypothetical protein